MSTASTGAHPCNLMAQDGTDGCDPPLIVEVLSDPDARAMYAALEEPKSASDLVEERGLSTSGVYRKLEILNEAGLIRPVPSRGSAATSYVRAMDCVSITYDEPIRIECLKHGLALHCDVPIQDR